MARGTRVVILNPDHACAVELRSDLLSVGGVRIVAETDDPAYLAGILEEFAAEVVVVNLDADPANLLVLIKDVAAKHPGLSIFGVSEQKDAQLIIEAMRVGIREYLVRPLDRKQLAESFARVAERIPDANRRGKLLCVVGSAGGLGSTTLATNLACELTTMGQRGAVLVDLDFLSGHVAMLLDLSPQFSITDLCGEEGLIDQSMIDKVLVKHRSGLHVLTSPNRYIKSHQLTMERAAAVINMLTENFDYVVCDGITRSGAADHAILDMTDSILLVLQMVLGSLHNAHRFMQMLEGEGYNLDRIELIINRYAKENSSIHPEDAEEKLRRKISWIIPSDWKTVSTAANLGQPISVYNPKSKVAESIHNLALKIHNPEKTSDEGVLAGVGQEKAGFWEKILGR